MTLVTGRFVEDLTAENDWLFIEGSVPLSVDCDAPSKLDENSRILEVVSPRVLALQNKFKEKF